MKKSSLISLFVLVGILACFSMSPVAGLTPKGLWGMSEGDQLYYKVSANNTGSVVVTYARVDVTSIYNGTYSIYYYNFINATTYVYTGTAWIKSYNDTQWAGYNTTWGWFGAYQVSLGFPNPAPLLPLIGFSWILVNASIHYWLSIAWLFSIQSYQDGNTVYYTNSSEEFYITYEPTTGVCTNNTHRKNGNLWTKQEYIGEVDPFAAPPPPSIPGYSPVLIVSMLGITALLIGLKMKKK